MRTIDDPRYIKAMSHPLRVRILAMLAERAASPVELAPRLGVSLSLTAYHVRTLYRLGLLELVRTTTVRGAIAHHYRAKDRPLVTDEAWAAASPIAKQAAIGSTLQIIDEYARAAAAAGGFDRREAHLTRTVVELDAQGWRDLSDACMELVRAVERIGEESAARLEAEGPHADRGRGSVVVMAFESGLLSDAPPPAREERPVQEQAGGRRGGGEIAGAR